MDITVNLNKPCTFQEKRVYTKKVSKLFHELTSGEPSPERMKIINKKIEKYRKFITS